MLDSLTPNLITTTRERVAAKLDELSDDERVDFEREMDLTPLEIFKYQEAKSVAYLEGTLTLDEANLIYRAIGESGGGANGGWATGVDLATKVAVTLVMGKLLLGARS